MLLSPLGIPERPINYDYQAIMERKPWLERNVTKALITLMGKGVSVLDVFRNSGIFAPKILSSYSRIILINLPLKHVSALETYLE